MPRSDIVFDVGVSDRSEGIVCGCGASSAMTVGNHGSILVQSLLLESAGDLGSGLESLPVLEEVGPFKPSSTGNPSPAFVTVSPFFSCEFSFAAHVQD